MAITTYVEFLNGLAALTVSGVTSKLTHPPVSLSSAELPVQWVQLPTGNEAPITFGTAGGWPTFQAEFVVAVEAVAQDRVEESFAATVSMLDNVSSALRGASLTRGPLRWSVRAVVLEVAGLAYWAVVATVEGSG